MAERLRRWPISMLFFWVGGGNKAEDDFLYFFICTLYVDISMFILLLDNVSLFLI